MKQTISNIVIIFIAGAVLIAVAWRLSANIRLEAEARLQTEESIAAALNKQYLAIKNFKDQLKAEQQERDFNRFLYGTSSPPPEVVQQQIERDLKRLAEKEK